MRKRPRFAMRSMQARSRRRIERGYMRVVILVSRLLRVEKERERAQAGIRDLVEANPQWKAEDTRRTVAAHLLLLAIPAAYIIDVCFLSQMTTWIASGAFARNSAALEAVKFVVPGAIVMIEITIATILAVAWQQRSWPRLTLFMVVASTMTLATPIVITANAFAKQAVRTKLAAAEGTVHLDGRLATIAGLEPKLFWTTAALATIALTAHALLLFGGTPAHDAKSFMLFGWRKRRLERRVQRLATSETTLRSQGSIAFRGYAGDVSVHRTRFQDDVPAGPFPDDVASRINRLFEQRVIAMTPADDGSRAGNGSSSWHNRFQDLSREAEARDTSAGTVSVPGGNGNGAELDYLRTVLDQRIRDEESELRP